VLSEAQLVASDLSVVKGLSTCVPRKFSRYTFPLHVFYRGLNFNYILMINNVQYSRGHKWLTSDFWFVSIYEVVNTIETDWNRGARSYLNTLVVLTENNKITCQSYKPSTV